MTEAVRMARLLATAKAACSLCVQVQQTGTGAVDKQDHTPVTVADYSVQALFGAQLAQFYPDDAVLAEESGKAYLALPAANRARIAELVGGYSGAREPVSEDQIAAWLDFGRDVSDARRTWVIDPIDGTAAFVAGGGRTYTVCVGWLEDGQLAGGIIGAPISPLHPGGTLFYSAGMDAGGILVEPLDGSGGPTRATVSTRGDAVEALVLLQSYDEGPRVRRFYDHAAQNAGIGAARRERFDSQLKYALVAAGYGDVFVRPPRDTTRSPHHIWDHAAGAALVVAAGGAYTAVDGAPVNWSAGRTLPHLGFIASRGGDLHARLLAGFGPVLAQFP